ncbi:PTS system mannose/fructose/N-acetylgalactosamine-transporter subunit IIB [Ligilactobacillus sp. LYQ139]|uniref:PTS system mannose/fructose/N-acetylgalactosamine-transporter subunit IIB n=1 Tax=Ligilactobacillus sp. LYQ139 TaxID=3378800 RepID=UPI00385398C4
MQVQLLRIDSRLLHGQVTTSWAKAFRLDRILVVDDAAAHDSLRQVLLQQAAPVGISVNVLTVNQAQRLIGDPRLASVRVMIITATPESARFLIEAGITVRSVNVGSLSFSAGRRMVTNAVAVDANDIVAFRWMHARGIQLDLRQVVRDSSRDLWRILSEKHLV